MGPLLIAYSNMGRGFNFQDPSDTIHFLQVVLTLEIKRQQGMLFYRPKGIDEMAIPPQDNRRPRTQKMRMLLSGMDIEEKRILKH